MLRIFKGDDTDFADANRLRITIGTAVVLAGCRAEFSFLGVTRQIPDASTGTFEVAFTAAETAVMPLGVHCATIRVFDAQGRQRTTTNTLRIEVTDNVDMAYSGENAADVDGHLVVKGVVDDGYGVPADLPEDYTPDEMRTFLNRLAALLRNSMPVAATLLMLAFAPAMGAEVEYARFGSMKATASVVTNVDLSAKADATNVYTKTETDARIVELAPMPDVNGKQDVLPYDTNAIPVDAVKWHSVYGDESMRHGWSITPDGTDPLYPGFTLYRGTGNAWPMPVLNVSTGGTVVLYGGNGHVAFDTLGIQPMFGGEIFWDDILTSSNVYKGTINYGMTDIFDLARVADTVRFVNDETGKKQDALPYPTNEIPFSAIDGVPAETDPTIPDWAKAATPTNMVRAIVTNEVPMLSDWEFSGDTTYFHHLNMRHTPASDAGGGTHEKWSLYENQFLLAEMEAGEFATNLYFSAAGITATRTVLGNVNALGLARLSDLPQLTNDVPSMISSAAQDATNYTDSAIADADTTYARFAVPVPTNVNQSVQYVNVAAETPSTLAVLLPQGSGTKDWIIYVNARTNVTISLPSATWWLADASTTNDIAPQTPTALYFSQAADGIYTLGRQEFTEVVLP